MGVARYYGEGKKTMRAQLPAGFMAPNPTP